MLVGIVSRSCGNLLPDGRSAADTLETVRCSTPFIHTEMFKGKRERGKRSEKEKENGK